VAVWASGIAHWAAWAGGASAPARKKASNLGEVCGLREKEKEKEKWVVEEMDRKRERVRGERFGFFFSNSFQIHFSNFQTSLKQETMHSNHDAQALIISNFIKMMFKYFLKANLFDNLIMSLGKN
jgi:hypothetical protein